ncbi:MAG: thioredoxin domain-containing protein [Candidatus Rokubacteria bacterium]|nr:thioredoxin domain-containing protein [Candidatus Rokubacteria bacterium]
MSTERRSADRAPNRLAKETSPYLLQHQYNPVDWYPWGEEAFARARAEGKPVLLSVGYSACHWCHVMERESFEDPGIANLMNERFVNVKVDREERPDVDAIYMQAVQSMTGHGGWPMTVFLTPEGVPFYGGTYFPPEDRHGIPGFPRILATVAEVYREQRDRVEDAGRRLLAELRQAERVRAGGDLLTREILDSAFQRLRLEFDARDGGLGRAPKFPQPMTWDFVLRYWRRTGRAEPLEMVRLTLDRMARGGIYDQLGGGFHRYAVDGVWLVPHFEKMLYDNSQLALLYLNAWQATGEGGYRRIATETLDYVVREMTHPDGGFYSTQDADSEGEEGKFFLWTEAELREVLDPDEAAAAALHWGLADGPNFEGRSILHLPREADTVAAKLGIDRGELDSLLGRARRKLFEVRERRVKPGRDEKVLAGWNGMMLRAFAEAARALERADFRAVAERNAAFLLRELRPQGRLLRTWKDGRSKLLGYLEDHAMVADGLLALYEATLDRRWLDACRELAEDMLRLFWDPSAEAFFDTGTDHEPLIVRPRNLFDSAVPSGTSVAADVLLRLAVLTGEHRYERTGVAAIRPVAPLMARYPSGFGRFLGALDFHLGPALELALLWPAGADESVRAPLLREVFSRYLPTRVLAGATGGETAGLPLLEGKVARSGQPTAYVCERYVCQAPTTEPAELGRQLDGRAGGSGPATAVHHQ